MSDAPTTVREQTPPGSFPAPAVPSPAEAFDGTGQVRGRAAEVTREYAVTSMGLPRRALDMIDSVVRDRGCFRGPSEYARIYRSDAAAAKAVNVLVAMALSEGITWLPSVDPPLRPPALMQTPGDATGALNTETPEQRQAIAEFEAEQRRYQTAREVRDLCVASAENLSEETPLLEALEDQTTAGAVEGLSIAEQTFEEKTTGRWAGRTLHWRYGVRERGAVQPVNDRHGRLLGFVPRGTPNTAAGIAAALLDKRKFCYFSPRRRAGDIRGVSMLEAARTPAEMKAHMWPEVLRHALRSPSTSSSPSRPTRRRTKTRAYRSSRRWPTA
jgi:hypothetical protein